MKTQKITSLLSVLILTFMFSQSVYPQEEEVTQEPPSIITEEPAEVPTQETPPVTAEATVEVPTQETPPVETENPPPAEEIPTEIPTEESTPEMTVAPTQAVTVEPTAVVTAEPEVTAEATAETTLEVTAEATEALSDGVSGGAVEMLLRYNPNASEANIQAMLQALGAMELERLPQIGAMRVIIPSQVSNTSAAQAVLQGDTLANAAGLMSVEPNYNYRILFTPNDPLFAGGLQPQLQDGAMAYSIYMETGWDLSTRDGQGVTVAVLDTGVDLQHPEFMGKLGAGWDFYNDDNSPDDDHGHGTHVAGIIGAKTNNGVGIAGMAYNAKVMPVKVCDAGGSCPVYEVAAGIVFAVDGGAKVINLSLGYTQFSSTLQGAVNYALSRNVVVVAAAGNNGDNNNATDEIMYPASLPGVISVASVQPNGDIAPTSNSNSNVTVAAPGVNILSTFPVDLTSSFAPGYESMSGTSMAAPHVAGLAALLIADNVATTPATVRDALICSALDMGAVGYDNSFGNGLIQGDYALTWRGNSSSCQATQPNDLIQNATTITTSPFTLNQTVNTRSVTENTSDPTICSVTPNQTLWYKFTSRTSGLYLFSTLGSSYDTLLGVYEGMPASLRELACNNDNGFGGGNSQLAVSLTKGITYYIQLGTNGSDTTGIVQLNVNPALTASTLQQETAAAIRYTGMWSRVRQAGANGGYVYTTTDVNATVSFLARGTSFAYTRLVGPDQGSYEVWIDGNVLSPTNLAPVTRSQTLHIALGIESGQWHLVTLRHAGAPGSLTIDAIQVTDGALPSAVVTRRVNETASQFTGAFLGGNWAAAAATGALNNDVQFTNDVGAYVQFRANGSAITFFRSTGAGTGQMIVLLDNELIEIVDNSLFADNPSVPYTIANLTPREYVVRVVHVGPGQLLFDGAQAVTQKSLTPAITDERSTNLAYTGIWTRTTYTAAQSRTLTTMAGNGGEVEFMFTGNHLCIGYQQNPTGGNLDVFMDGVNVGTINSNGGLLNKVEWCTYNNGINQLTDTPHKVQLVAPSGNNFSLDYVRPVRRTVFTPSMGYIAETNAGIFYDTAFGVWTTSRQRSAGGGKFQGGSALQADISPTPGQRLSFTINGTGFILYTAIDVDGQAGAYEVYVDGVLQNFTFDGGTVGYIDLWDGRNFGFRPVGIGVTDFPPGIHHIELRTVAPFGGNVVHFDGIRVLP